MNSCHGLCIKTFIKYFRFFFTFVLVLAHLGIFESDAGYLVPEMCVESHLEMATGCGADLRFNETVTSWSLVRGAGHDCNEDELKRSSEASGDSEETASSMKDDQGASRHDSGEVYKVCSRSTNGAVVSEFSYFTKQIVIAAGAWAPELYGSEIPISLHAERRVQYWFQPKSCVELFKVYHLSD